MTISSTLKARLALVALAVPLVLVGCTKTKEVVVEQTVIVERTVIVAPTPVVSTYTSAEVIGILTGSRGVALFKDGTALPSTVGDAVNTFCYERLGPSTPPAVWTAALRAAGRWSIQAKCGGEGTSGFLFSWQFFEDESNGLPSNDYASFVTYGP